MKLKTFILIASIAWFMNMALVSNSYAESEVKAPEPKNDEIQTAERDPMWPVSMALFEPVKQKQVKQEKKHAPFRIQGKGKSSKGSYVIIGGNVLREGETKGEITVVKIGETKVDILVNGIPESLPVE